MNPFKIEFVYASLLKKKKVHFNKIKNSPLKSFILFV